MMVGQGWGFLVLTFVLNLVSAVPVSVREHSAQEGRESRALIDSPLPVVMWHGMGDTCCLPMSMGKVKSIIEDSIPGVYVRSLMIGQSETEDQYNGFLMPIAKQLSMACDIVTKDPKLQMGFHAVGFSQGGLFLRALVQTCATARIINLVSIGGPQQGVFGAPRCIGINNTLCATMRELLELGAYLPMVQNRLVQAQYWHDPLHHDKYVSGNVFLPTVNNEVMSKTSEYKLRIASLNKFVMVKFLEDTVVVPRESTWFGFLNDKRELVPMEATALYTEDWIGLKSLNDAGRLVFMTSPGDHLDMPKGYFEKQIIPLLAEQA